MAHRVPCWFLAGPVWFMVPVSGWIVHAADLSFLMSAEERGTVLKENGRAKPGLQIFRDHGYNWIRLQLFHTPSAHRDNMPHDLDYTTRLGRGIFWWEPAVPLRPGISSRGIFDMEGNVLSAIQVFDKFTRGRAGRFTGPGGITQ